MAKQFYFCFIRPEDISPKGTIFVPMCSCKPLFYGGSGAVAPVSEQPFQLCRYRTRFTVDIDTLVPVPVSSSIFTSSVRQCLSGHKRRAKSILLAILPRPLQSAHGYLICTSICWSLSTELVSPTKPKKQQTWVEALTQELVEDEDPFVDPDYEAGSLAMGCLTGPNPSLLTLVV
uniref:Uncharacterized protein n=1 Tax=Oncorhynchus kisutch TaxID=8019 RepID=A0A8C7H0J8_ONCKI